mmetsp:Transcript_22769/g.63592  ORF Transcript_22769/g.63592 Transcript_22769/m.63592 type:complete len:233 (+) Transcript_22769:276-974(+)
MPSLQPRLHVEQHGAVGGTERVQHLDSSVARQAAVHERGAQRHLCGVPGDASTVLLFDVRGAIIFRVAWTVVLVAPCLNEPHRRVDEFVESWPRHVVDPQAREHDFVHAHRATLRAREVAGNICTAFSHAASFRKILEPRRYISPLLALRPRIGATRVHLPHRDAERPHVGLVGQHHLGHRLGGAPSGGLRLLHLNAAGSVLHQHRKPEVRHFGDSEAGVWLPAEDKHVAAG